MKKLIAVPLLLCCAQVTQGQCGPNPCYKINPPAYVHLTPSQAAAQGSATATISGQPDLKDSNGNQLGLTSHNATVTIGPNGATHVIVGWNTNNTVSQKLYYSWNYGALSPWTIQNPDGSVGTSGSYTYVVSNPGNTLQFWIVGTGASGVTTDAITLVIQSGAGPGIIAQDGQPENDYAQINTSGGGGSMAADFVECQAGQIHQCINATHTPYSQVSVTNQQTGDSLFHSKHVAGNVAKYNEQVSYGDSLCCISVVDGNILSFREDDEVDCSVAGPVPPPPKHQDVQFGLKITYTWVSALLKSNGMHPQAPYCSDASSPPDWPGPFEANAPTKSGEYAAAEEMYREVPAGQSFTGVPWNWWFSYFSEPYVYPTHPFPPNCTNTDKGFRNGINVFWPLPGMIF